MSRRKKRSRVVERVAVTDFKSLSYRELQRWAKLRGIRANLSHSALVAALSTWVI